ncbi:hypothetical protein P5673_003242 [Acropora cervicornis]|uniref:Uncharacterized protein n=1 Tax=Acropora cervicornis TaxID=6130 RepID=A0AAD9R325_ACRCE|nr:hypothetical protein P5673_003242 [Acropora cervicornis]
MQQTATVPSHSTTTSTSPVNSTQGAMTSSTSVNQIQSTNLKTSQSRSTYPQNPPWSPSPSFNCASWSVKQGGCSEACSNVGGTVTETCQCISNSITIPERSVCENYGITTTRTGTCAKLCPASGLQQGELFAISFLLSLRWKFKEKLKAWVAFEQWNKRFGEPVLDSCSTMFARHVYTAYLMFYVKASSNLVSEISVAISYPQ